MVRMPPSVCAVVPCGPHHVRIVHEAIESLDVQTLRPKTISLRFSSVRTCPIKTRRIRHIRNLVISCTTSRETDGMVRNMAMRECRGESYVTFLDGDDLALPYAIERIVTLMRAHNASVGILDYFRKGSTGPVFDNSKLVPLFRAASLPPFAGIDAHMAHPTVRREALIPQRNTSAAEDSLFVRDLWLANATFVYTAERLTRYMDRQPKRTKRKRVARAVLEQRPWYERLWKWLHT